MARPVRPLALVVGVVFVAVASLSLTGCVADPPPLIGAVVGDDGQVSVSWSAPVAAPAPITAYVVTPWIGSAPQTPVRFNSTATTQSIPGLLNGTTYTFTVKAINALGNDSASSGTSSPVTPGPRLAAGDWHNCAVVGDGTVKCWGSNGFGQLGNGTSQDATTAVAVTGLTGATAIAAGIEHTCALVDGTVMCWGSNAYGQLGNGTISSTPTLTPVAVPGISGASAISAGFRATCALVGGTVLCWGSGPVTGATTSPYLTVSPTPVEAISGATAIAINSGVGCALVGGIVKCWGSNSLGELGDGTRTASATPVTVIGLTDAVRITTGGHHVCAVQANGHATCWGYNAEGQLGINSASESESPTPVSGMTTAAAIGGGSVHTCAVLADKTARCWGYNFYGQVGDGQIEPICRVDPCDGRHDDYTPTTVKGIPPNPTLTGVTALNLGFLHTCARLVDGSVMCWGDNSVGQLGLGYTRADDGNSTPVGTVVGL